MRIVFAGTPEFAVPALAALIDAGQRVVGAFTQPDRGAGRGRKLVASPVKRLAEKAQIPVFQPTRLDSEALRSLSDLRPDLMVVVAYGLILPPPVLAVPAHGCWNLHASLLPRWRGAAPIQRAILAGDAETGVCLMQMDAGLDTGPVLARRRTAIDAEDTAGTLAERLAQIGAELLLECLQQPANLVPRAQPDDGVSYARKIDKQEALLDWRREATFLARQVRAFDPWPVAVGFVNGERLRIWKATPLAARGDAPAGQVVAAGADGIDVATGSGVLRLQQVQRAGGRRVEAADYLNSRSLRPGDRFESSAPR